MLVRGARIVREVPGGHSENDFAKSLSRYSERMTSIRSFSFSPDGSPARVTGEFKFAYVAGTGGRVAKRFQIESPLDLRVAKIHGPRSSF